MTRNKGILLVIASALLYGFAPVLCSMTYQYGNNPITLTFFRSFFVVILLGMLMIKNKIPFRCEKGELIRIVGVALFGSIMTTLLLNSSYLYIGVGTATTLHFLDPVSESDFQSQHNKLSFLQQMSKHQTQMYHQHDLKPSSMVLNLDHIQMYHLFHTDRS